MNDHEQLSKRSIPSNTYSREYYESCCHGYEEYYISKGKIIPKRLKIPLDLIDIIPDTIIIDIGCGRGEIIYQCALQGARVCGLDYATEAIKLAQSALNGLQSEDIQLQFSIERADARFLPYPTNFANIIFMLDVVEHLASEELSEAFDESWRVLKPGGQLIIHTMPNLWYYRFGYPLFRIVELMRGRNLPKNPRERWEFSHVHVNEQDPRRLLNSLKASNFNARVWLQTTQTYSHEKNPILRLIMKGLSTIFPFRLIFCNDIFAIGIK